MAKKEFYVAGTWNAICDRCGFKFKANELREDWQGFMVCEADYDERNPVDFFRVREETTGVPWTRPEPTDVFVGDNVDDSSLGEVTLGDNSLG